MSAPLKKQCLTPPDSFDAPSDVSAPADEREGSTTHLHHIEIKAV